MPEEIKENRKSETVEKANKLRSKKQPKQKQSTRAKGTVEEVETKEVETETVNLDEKFSSMEKAFNEKLAEIEGKFTKVLNEKDDVH